MVISLCASDGIRTKELLELDVSPALIGYHFKSRDALVMETMRWALTGTVRRIVTAADADRGASIAQCASRAS